MAEGNRIPLAEARDLAALVVAMLQPCTERIMVAGSIRRQRAMVGDIEIVAIPKRAHRVVDLFARVSVEDDLLADRCATLLANGTFAKRLDKNGRPSVGPEHKRLMFRDVGVDLFVTNAEKWGMIVTIRTGPADFSKRLVTRRAAGGFLPNHLKVRDGRLRRFDDDTIVAETLEERDVFAAIGIPYIEPEQRTGRETFTYA